MVRWVDMQDESEVRTALIQANCDAALQAAAATWNREERAKSSVYTTAETVLAAYADPVVAASAESHHITPARFVARRCPHPLHRGAQSRAATVAAAVPDADRLDPHRRLRARLGERRSDRTGASGGAR